MRLKFAWVWILFMGSFWVFPQDHPPQAETIAPDLVIEKIEDDVFFITHHFPWPANSLLVHITDAEFVLVDTPWTDTATQDLVTWLKRKYGEVHLTVINTHFHRDNLGGNKTCLDHGYPVHGSDLTVSLLKQRAPQVKKRLFSALEDPKYTRFRKVFEGSRLFPPNHVFPINEGGILTIGHEAVEIFFPGAAHAPDNIVVYFPERKLLFGGCMIRSLDSRRIGKHGDGDMQAWPQSAKNVRDKYPEAQIVIPGHGAWGDISLVHHTIELLRRHADEAAPK